MRGCGFRSEASLISRHELIERVRGKRSREDRSLVFILCWSFSVGGGSQADVMRGRQGEEGKCESQPFVLKSWNAYIKLGTGDGGYHMPAWCGKRTFN